MQLSKNTFPPGGWQFFQPQTNWRAPKEGSFSVIVGTILKMRLNNPGKNLSTNPDVIERELLDYTRARVNAVHPGYYEPEPVAAKKKLTAFSSFRQTVSRVKNRVARLVAGVETLSDWVGEGNYPVEAPIAQQRAAICASCPLNQGGDWLNKVLNLFGSAIVSQMQLKDALQLKTDADQELNVCTACDCHLPLKVWVPIKHIADNMSAETKARLDSRCWIPKEIR